MCKKQGLLTGTSVWVSSPRPSGVLYFCNSTHLHDLPTVSTKVTTANCDTLSADIVFYHWNPQLFFNDSRCGKENSSAPRHAKNLEDICRKSNTFTDTSSDAEVEYILEIDMSLLCQTLECRIRWVGGMRLV